MQMHGALTFLEGNSSPFLIIQLEDTQTGTTFQLVMMNALLFQLLLLLTTFLTSKFIRTATRRAQEQI